MKKLTILLALVALVCFSAPAMAVDWNFYGNARMATYYESTDLGQAGQTTAGNDQDQQLEWDLQSNSRIGANIKAEHLKAQFEWGVSSDSGGGGNVGARRLYGVWETGWGSMKVGKDYTPVSQFTSGQVFDGDLGLLGIGTAYGNREAQVAFSFGNFEIAFIEMNVQQISTAGGTASAGDLERVLPKLEAKWGMSFDAFNFNLMGGYQYYSIKDAPNVAGTDTNNIGVTSYIVGGDAGFNFGPAYVKGTVSYGQNWDNAKWNLGGNHNQGSPAIWNGNSTIKDTTSWMASLVAGLKVSDMLTFEAGFGYREDDPDVSGAKTSNPWCAYGQAVIALAPGVYIIPEIGYFDGDQDFAGNDAATLFYAGGKWQINF
jgi:hypothetical protein